MAVINSCLPLHCSHIVKWPFLHPVTKSIVAIVIVYILRLLTELPAAIIYCIPSTLHIGSARAVVPKVWVGPPRGRGWVGVTSGGVGGVEGGKNRTRTLNNQLLVKLSTVLSQHSSV